MSFAMLISSSMAHAAEWINLGSRTVDRVAETDTIVVTGKKGRFSAIQFGVAKGKVQIYNIKVTFANGSSFSPVTRLNFANGARSRAIDLPGKARRIKKVEFLYKSKRNKKNPKKLLKSIVTLYGKKSKSEKMEDASPKKQLTPAQLEKKFPKWKHLGSRKVDFGMDRDVIKPGPGAYKAIKMFVRKGDVVVYDIVVTFANGKRYSPKVRLKFAENSRSRDIDLPGKKRRIKKIEFVYKSKKKNGKARVHVLGKK